MDSEMIFKSEVDKVFKTDWDGESYYTEEDYAELQRNLILYKQGNAEAATYILRVFHHFISKYTNFIVYGNIPYMQVYDKNGNLHYKINSSISKFVSLFIDKQSESKNEKKKVFSNTCYKIKNLFKKYEYGDIYNELVLALLNMANKYKIITDKNDPHYKKNGTFHMYVGKCFHWEAHRYLKGLIKDPITHLETTHLCDQFEDIDYEKSEILETSLKDDNARICFEDSIEELHRESLINSSKALTLKEEDIDIHDVDDALNFNWTNGVTCSELFKELTPYERELIVLSFIKNKTDIEIGKIYGCHRGTINLHKNKAIEKIKLKAQQQSIIKKEE